MAAGKMPAVHPVLYNRNCVFINPGKFVLQYNAKP